MFETADRGIKRTTSKLKLSQQNRIDLLIKQYEDLGEEFIDYKWIKKLFKSLQEDAKSVLFMEENTNGKLLKKNLKVEIWKRHWVC